MPEDKSAEAPAPQVLQVQDEGEEPPEQPQAGATGPGANKPATKPRRGTYRPSHKATFIGLGVVVIVLAINAGVVMFLMRGQEAAQQVQREQVTISTDQLEKLGVNRTSVGNLGTELVVGPDSRFNGKLSVASDVDIAGQLRLNNTVSAADANLTKLSAGETSLAQLNVNEDATATNLTLREGLNVAGITQLQGAVTVNNNMNVIGNLTVGGALFAGSFQAGNLVAATTLTLGGHVESKGTAPGVSAGGAVGSNGTVSISGTDTTGTVAVNVGSGGGNGVLAEVVFHQAFGATPHVVVTAIGRSAGSIYVNRTANGFSISVGNALSPGGYAFDYIVIQ